MSSIWNFSVHSRGYRLGASAMRCSSEFSRTCSLGGGMPWNHTHRMNRRSKEKNRFAGGLGVRFSISGFVWVVNISFNGSRVNECHRFEILSLLIILVCFSTLRKGARVVESTGLENRNSHLAIEGSNPSPSAENNHESRRGARVVELATLERWYTGNGIVGSNPTLSAVCITCTYNEF
jgi:hypothetical protein